MMTNNNDNRQSVLTAYLKEYEKNIGDITVEERKELRTWVSAGNSPYDNPHLLYSESGCPMDYVTATRIADDMMHSPQDYVMS